MELDYVRNMTTLITKGGWNLRWRTKFTRIAVISAYMLSIWSKTRHLHSDGLVTATTWQHVFFAWSNWMHWRNRKKELEYSANAKIRAIPKNLVLNELRGQRMLQIKIALEATPEVTKDMELRNYVRNSFEEAMVSTIELILFTKPVSIFRWPTICSGHAALSAFMISRMMK